MKVLYLFTILLIQHLKVSHSNNWIIGTPNMIAPVCQAAIGYDESQNEIVIVGGRFFVGHQRVYVYNIDNNNFTQSDDLPSWVSMTSQSYTQINELLYMIKSTGEDFYYAVYDLNTRIFTENYHNTLIPYRASRACLTHWNNNYLITIGGYFGGYRRNVAIYSIVDDIWLSNVPTLQQPRDFASCIASNGVALNNNVYIFGGIYNYDTIDTIEKLDLYEFIMRNDTNITWKYNDYPLSTAKRNTRPVIYGDNVYIIGGQHIQQTTSPFAWYTVSDVDVLNLATETVSSFAELVYDTSIAQCIVVDHRMYVFGGQRENETFDSVVHDDWQYYDFLQTSEPTTTTIQSTLCGDNKNSGPGKEIQCSSDEDCCNGFSCRTKDGPKKGKCGKDKNRKRKTSDSSDDSGHEKKRKKKHKKHSDSSDDSSVATNNALVNDEKESISSSSVGNNDNNNNISWVLLFAGICIILCSVCLMLICYKRMSVTKQINQVIPNNKYDKVSIV